MTHIRGAYTIIRGSKGFVSCVTKKRVKTPDGRTTVKDVERVCGLGVMTQQEFEAFKAWAKQFKGEERRSMVLSSGRAIAVREYAEKEVATDTQKKTTVKKPQKEIKVLSDDEKELKRISREKELKEQELRVIANMTPQQKRKRIKDILDDQKDLQIKFKKFSGIKEDIEKDNIKHPHKVSGNVKNTIFANEKLREIKEQQKILGKQKQQYRDSLKKIGGRW